MFREIEDRFRPLEFIDRTTPLLPCSAEKETCLHMPNIDTTALAGAQASGLDCPPEEITALDLRKCDMKH